MGHLLATKRTRCPQAPRPEAHPAQALETQAMLATQKQPIGERDPKFPARDQQRQDRER